MDEQHLPAVPPASRKRFAEIQAQVDARTAAEAADPSLFWRRMGVQAARDAALAERLVPVEGVAAFRQAFDEALPSLRESDLLGRDGGTVRS
ncbi:hypothetical protein [Dactylosporangium sp. CA-139066]|uniref:hypothetical protein n=1 Tax=Dactylosporangium sp. CA-139066 TaxID=3239930 RepID=UPI003D8FA0F4